MSCKQPKILLVSHPPTAEVEYYYIFPYYVNALRQSGASVIIITPGEKNDCIKNIYDIADGVLFTGGGDLDPAIYNGDTENKHLYGINKERDATEIELCRLALAGDKPVMAVCRGLQLVNVMLGGTLHEDMGFHDDEDSMKHRISMKKGINHKVSITGKGKILASISSEQMDVVSWHHQSIKNLGKGLVTVACSDDGTVEACEYPDHAWFMGVQWHPEMSFEKDSTQKDLFNSFVQACSNSRK